MAFCGTDTVLKTIELLEIMHTPGSVSFFAEKNVLGRVFNDDDGI